VILIENKSLVISLKRSVVSDCRINKNKYTLSFKTVLVVTTLHSRKYRSHLKNCTVNTSCTLKQRTPLLCVFVDHNRLVITLNVIGRC
jgi:hypothetical protein